ncbi:MAG: hypothetical protein ABIO06_08790 [Pseudolysinimonas sp.]
MADAPKKKVVRVEETAAEKAAGAAAPAGATWTPTAEAKKKATTFRILAIVLWLLAIGTEAFAIFWVLKQNPINMVLLIGLLVAIAALAIGGSLLWKQSNRLDPASKSEPVRFFVQNQLGVIISAIAFIPLIILIFTNKNMSGQQKAIAGIIAIVLLGASGTLGATVNPPSTEQYTAETQTVTDATGGQNLVYWTKEGKVFHLCAAVSAVNLQSKDNQIYSGTVAEAHAAGKPRLTLQVEQERHQCGFDATDSPSPTP